ncbi:RagB/SusD family nutrient uptake outer membrane protein [Patiriisocius sp. Uisw_047]|jgi:hypothetical protein|uniref:RagB/SusD family nutrient uptake outer membrane protein n=1 Tax=Patiriisocius sp. Uisw_047 TaxID=3230969 RepID=UPI0039E78613
MKKIKYIAVFVLASIGFTSCTDAIEITQVGILNSDAAFITVGDLQLGLLGAYDNFDHTQQIQFNSVFTDEISVGADSGGQGTANGDTAFVLNAGSAFPAALWLNNNAALNSVNRVIAGAEGIEIGEGEQAQYDDILGQSYALRAYAHFELLSYLSADYTDDSTLATILLDFVPQTEQKLPRNTNGEIYASITSDLNLANGLLSNQADAVFVSRDFVKALRARMAAYRQDYSTANTLATELLGAYGIANQTQYTDMYLDLDNTEIIFKLSRTIGDSYDGQGATGSAFAGGWAGANYAFVNATINGSPYFEMGRAVFNAFSTDDVRYSVNVHPTSIIDPNYQTSSNPLGTDVLVIGKYPGKDGQNLMNDLKIFKSSEMLLIAAEARASMNDLVGAEALIDQLRDARFGSDQPAPNFASTQEALAAVMDERRLELLFEGHRYKDLKRLGARAGRGIDRDPIDCIALNACDLALSSNLFTVPIPIVELDANDNIQQNPGY